LSETDEESVPRAEPDRFLAATKTNGTALLSSFSPDFTFNEVMPMSKGIPDWTNLRAEVVGSGTA
jgi:hypothetical protein